MAPQRREPTTLRPASLEHARDVFVRDLWPGGHAAHVERAGLREDWDSEGREGV